MALTLNAPNISFVLKIRPLDLVLLVAVTTLAACGQRSGGKTASGDAKSHPAALVAPAAPGMHPYTVSAQGGTPATGPGERYNHCERVWCMVHRENFFIDHFLKDHIGWILHDDLGGDIFVAKGRIDGPEFPHAKATVLRFCGKHVHPYFLAKGGGPVRDGYYTVGLGYDRAHFRTYGTRLEPCCINGLGSDYIHAHDGRHMRFNDVAEYRAHPEMGWQKPYNPVAALTPPQ